MDDVALEDMTSSTGTLDLVGPRAAELISELARADISALPASAHVEATLGSIPCRIIRHTWIDHPAAALVVAREQLTALWQELEGPVRAHGGVPVGLEALNSIRLESGTAWFGQDYDERNIPHEAGLELSHISYEKGCYPGQEIVERVRSRGHVNRRLTGLQFLAEKSPTPGAKLFFMGNEAGHVTSTAISPLLGRPMGLGYVRREHSSIGTRLDASGTVAEVIPLPVLEKNFPG
jgi:folate-binding protein YgfZ